MAPADSQVASADQVHRLQEACWPLFYQRRSGAGLHGGRASSLRRFRKQRHSQREGRVIGLLGSFFGSDQRRDIQSANRQATKALDKGYNQAYGDYTSAASSYDPYVQQGNAANAFYGNALGLNGTDAQSGAINTLTSNPLFSGQLAQDSNAMSRVLNAQGASGGGKAQLAAQRVFQQTAGNWLDRYKGLGDQGLQATGAKSNALMGRGELSMGFGATKAGNAINYGNALAANRSTGINNLMGLGSLAINGANAWRQPTKIGSA